jgi:hypothetical protein
MIVAPKRIPSQIGHRRSTLILPTRRELVAELGHSVGASKIGLQLFKRRAGLRSRGNWWGKVFDLKFRYSEYCSECRGRSGPTRGLDVKRPRSEGKMMRQTAEVRKPPYEVVRPKVAAVTCLSSDANELREIIERKCRMKF